MLNQAKKIYLVLDRRTKTGLIGIFLLMLIAALLEMASIGLFVPLINLLVDPDSLSDMPIIGQLLVSFPDYNSNQLILGFSVAFFLFFLIKNIVLGAIIYIQNRFIQYKLAAFSCDLLKKYLDAPYTFHLQRNSAELIRNITTLTVRLYAKGLLPILQFILEFMTAVGILSITILVDPVLTVSIGVLMTITGGAFYLVTKRRIQTWGERTIDADREILLWINQSIGAVKEVTVLGRKHYFQMEFARPSFRRARYTSLSATAPHLPRMFIEVVGVAGILVLVSVFIILRNNNAEAIIPTLGIFGVAVIRLMPAFSRMVSNITLFRENTSAVDAIFDDVMESFGNETDSTEINAAKTPDSHRQFEKQIEFENVSFSYPDEESPAIRSINLTIKKGGSVALTGRSGAGKSTLVDIMLGLLTCDSGRILCDGQNIYDNINEWQGRIGYIPQFIYLTDDTVKKNIAFGIAESEIDDQKLADVVKLAQLDSVIEQLPAGLDTVLGEHGTRLSGGQRQRIGIARALYHDPEILVMDEATAALDGETEQEIGDAIRQFKGNKTVVVISHRVSSVEQCETVVFLDRGQIAAEGSFNSLKRSSPEFVKAMGISTGPSEAL